jgi:hypothetical protein
VQQPPELVVPEPAERAVLVLPGLLLPLSVVRVLDPVIDLVVPVVIRRVVAVGYQDGRRLVLSCLHPVQAALRLVDTRLAGPRPAGGFFHSMLWGGNNSRFWPQGVGRQALAFLRESRRAGEILAAGRSHSAQVVLGQGFRFFTAVSAFVVVSRVCATRWIFHGPFPTPSGVQMPPGCGVAGGALLGHKGANRAGRAALPRGAQEHLCKAAQRDHAT